MVEDHHFDALFDAYLGDERVRGFIAEANPAALREIAERFPEAIERGLWRPRRNSAHRQLEELRAGGSTADADEQVRFAARGSASLAVASRRCGMAQVKEKLWTLEEFLAFDDGTDTSYQLFEGRIVAMNPPLRGHASLVGRLAGIIGSQLKPPCEV